MIGTGVMLKELACNKETALILKGCLNETIEKVWLDSDRLYLKFLSGASIYLFDDGQLCCETRYMRTDDNLDEFSGAKLLDVGIKDAPDIEDEYGNVHEVQFLEVKTDKGSFVMSNHNEHNGNYGGFCIVAIVNYD